MSQPLAKFCAAVAAMIGLALVFGAAGTNGPFSAATAAWVQAIGSISAVVGAAWIASRQSREALERDARREEAADRVEQDALRVDREMAITLVSQARKCVANLSKLATKDTEFKFNRYSLTLLEKAVTSVSSFKVERLKRSDLIDVFGKAQSILYVTMEYIGQRGEQLQGAANDDVRRAILTASAKQLDEHVSRLKSYEAALSDA